MGKIDLDKIENIQMDQNSPPLANYQALTYLAQGLFKLATVVRRQEIEIIKKYNGKPHTFIMMSSRSGDIPGDFHSIFNWFATDLVNYGRLIGLIDYLQKKSLNIKDISYQSSRADQNLIRNEAIAHSKSYVQKVFPEICQWRNKISAHFAVIDPYKDDNLATLEISVMCTVSYTKPYYEAGSFSWTHGQDTSLIPKWKLTKIYEELIPRYWSTIKLHDLPPYQ